MFSTGEIDRSATVVITHRVREHYEFQYEQWLSEIIPICKTYPGHLGVQVIKPIAEDAPTYTIIIRYDNKENLQIWMRSHDREKLIAKVRPLLSNDDRFQVLEGWDFWFTPEHSKAKLPTRWKQFLVTWSAIYPLVVFVSQLVAMTMRKFNVPDSFYLRMLLVTCIVVASMAYVVMPRYTKLVHNWLFS